MTFQFYIEYKTKTNLTKLLCVLILYKKYKITVFVSFQTKMETQVNNSDNFLTVGNTLMKRSLRNWLDVNSWTPMNQGALVVVLDMTLAVTSIFFNIVVITALRQKQEMLSNTFNLVLLNLCSANLLSAVLVKSISIVHHGYSVAANVVTSNIAFCLLYTFSFRLTWAVLPWTIVMGSWLTISPRIRRIQVRYKDKLLMKTLIE